MGVLEGLKFLLFDLLNLVLESARSYELDYVLYLYHLARLQ